MSACSAKCWILSLRPENHRVLCSEATCSSWILCDIESFKIVHATKNFSCAGRETSEKDSLHGSAHGAGSLGRELTPQVSQLLLQATDILHPKADLAGAQLPYRPPISRMHCQELRTTEHRPSLRAREGPKRVNQTSCMPPNTS